MNNILGESWETLRVPWCWPSHPFNPESTGPQHPGSQCRSCSHSGVCHHCQCRAFYCLRGKVLSTKMPSILGFHTRVCSPKSWQVPPYNWPETFLLADVFIIYICALHVLGFTIPSCDGDSHSVERLAILGLHLFLCYLLTGQLWANPGLLNLHLWHRAMRPSVWYIPGSVCQDPLWTQKKVNTE